MNNKVNIMLTSILLCSLCVMSCGKSLEDEPSSNKNRNEIGKTTVNQNFNLEPSVQQELEEHAEKGNGEAAQRLYIYYTLYKYDEVKALYWMRKAAENGNPVAQRNLGVKMLESPEYGTKEEANYWLSKAAKAGNWDAKIELGLHLSNEDIQTLSKQSDEGNIQSSHLLWKYYEYVEKDDKLAKYWFNREQKLKEEQFRKIINEQKQAQ